MHGKLLIILMLVAPVVVRANLVQNPGFESDSQGDGRVAMNWRMNEPDDHGDTWGSAIRMDWRAHEGGHGAAVRGTWAQSGDFGGLWQEAEVEQGKKYRLAAWFWADASWSARVQELKIEFWDVGRTRKLGEVVNSFNDISEFWMEKSVEGIAPEGSFWARIVINVSGAGPGGALQIDDVSLQSVP